MGKAMDFGTFPCPSFSMIIKSNLCPGRSIGLGTKSILFINSLINSYPYNCPRFMEQLTLHNRPLYGGKRKDIMNIMEQQTSKVNVEQAKIQVFTLLTQCIRDIEEAVTSSGVTMHDVGLIIEKYITGADSYIIELDLHM